VIALSIVLAFGYGQDRLQSETTKGAYRQPACRV
jgi:hypothetical protein